MLFQMMALFSAVGRNGKGYTIVGVRSLVVDEVNRQISLFYNTDGLICTVMSLVF